MAYSPVLSTMPDGRLTPWPLLPAFVIGYVGLVFGAGVAGLAALYNALLMRRLPLAAIGLVVGVAGWFAFPLFVEWIYNLFGPEMVRYVGLWMHGYGAFFGLMLAIYQSHYIRACTIIDSETAPLLPAVIGVYVASIIIPVELKLMLHGLYS